MLVCPFSGGCRIGSNGKLIEDSVLLPPGIPDCKVNAETGDVYDRIEQPQMEPGWKVNEETDEVHDCVDPLAEKPVCEVNEETGEVYDCIVPGREGEGMGGKGIDRGEGCGGLLPMAAPVAVDDTGMKARESVKWSCGG